MSLASLAEAEKKITSQNGEDGVIEAIFTAIGATNRFVVEFGVEDATECNSANLLNQGWTGLLMDGEGISHNPLATVHQEFITAENINELFAKYAVPHEFDFLSIDIDGNDYWIWQALTYRPRVVAIEYNASVPPELARVIVYEPNFKWNGTDYFGASLRALADLGRRKGYELVYCERAGVNAFFIARSELPADYVARPLAEIYRPANYFYQGRSHRHDPWRTMFDPDGAELFNRAVRSQQQGHTDNAEALYRQLLKDDASNTEAIYWLALLEDEKGNHDAARKLIRQAIDLNPSVVVAYYNPAKVPKTWDPMEAIASYREALRRDPTLVDAHFHLGIMLKDMHLWHEAEGCFRQVLNIEPTNGSAHNNLGNILMKQGLLMEAVTCFQEALRLNPKYANACNNLGIAYYRLGRPAQAIDSFQEALRLDPRYQVAENNLRLVWKSQESK